MLRSKMDIKKNTKGNKPLPLGLSLTTTVRNKISGMDATVITINLINYKHSTALRKIYVT